MVQLIGKTENVSFPKNVALPLIRQLQNRHFSFCSTKFLNAFSVS